MRRTEDLKEAQIVNNRGRKMKHSVGEKNRELETFLDY